MASQMPDRPIIQRDPNYKHTNSKRVGRRASARQHDDNTEAAHPKQPRLHILSLTEVARGMPCCLEVPDVCNGNPETTVWCHANTQEWGKGMSAKCDDFMGVFGCAACHRWLDEPKNADAANFIFQEAYRRTWRFLWGHGIVRIDEAAAKRVRYFA